MKISEALSEIVSNLEAVGLAATDNPGIVNLPGALVLPGKVTFPYMSAEAFNLEVEILLLAANKGLITLDHLQEMLDKLREAYDISEAKLTGYKLPNLPDICSAYVVTLSLRITKD